MDNRKCIALFDFDGTITAGDTFISFARYAVGDKAFRKAFLRAVPWLVAWKLKLISNSAAKQRLFGLLYRGMPVEVFCSECAGFAALIDSDLKADTMQALEHHKQSGHRVVIVSASVEDWIRPWAEAHGVHHVIGTQIEVDASGCLTGRFASPNCHGREKMTRIHRAIPDIAGYEVWAYGDSAGDEPMLALADHPVRVK